jgi:hypothetical protein
LLLLFFWIRSCFDYCASMDGDPPIYGFHIAGVSGVYHHAQLSTCWDGLSWTFSCAGFPDFPCLSS